MSKFVKIPSYKNPYEVIINGVKYQYPAGETCLVPDGVAMVIKNAENNAPKYAKENVRRPDIVETVSGEVIAVSDSAEAPLQGLKVFGKTIQNGTPTPDAPVALKSVGDIGNIGVTVVTGKNLLAKPFLLGTHSQTGYTNANTRVISTDGFCLKAGTYVISGTISDALTLYINGMINIKTTSGYQKNIPGRVFDIHEDGMYNVQFNRSDGKDFTDAEIQAINGTAQVEVGRTPTSYEPYKGKTLTATTPNGLPGIPVASGGNYTDAKGQQWICDEVDFEKGVYTQRVEKINSYNGQALPGAYISSTGELSTGAVVLYQLAGDKKTDINKAKLAAYAAIHTNYPGTTVYNDAGAGMELKYMADTKLYVDKKFNVLAAMVNNA